VAIFSPELAPLVGADLGVMDRDTQRMRGERPVGSGG
jgi:Ni2+-binding GTPase involved in maturation of urease and hydrogenase